MGASEVFPSISRVPDDRSKSSRLCRHGSIQLLLEFLATDLYVAGPGQLAPGQLEVLRSNGDVEFVECTSSLLGHTDAAFPPLRSWKGHCLHNGAGYVLIQAWPTGDLEESFSELLRVQPGGALASPESSTPPRTFPGEALSLEETPRTSGLISFAPSPQL
ncbi:ANK3, partial [Symbiodinium sp. CCMP2456]